MDKNQNQSTIIKGISSSSSDEIKLKIRSMNKEFDIKIKKSDSILTLKQKIEQVSNIKIIFLIIVSKHPKPKTTINISRSIFD